VRTVIVDLNGIVKRPASDRRCNAFQPRLNVSEYFSGFDIMLLHILFNVMRKSVGFGVARTSLNAYKLVLDFSGSHLRKRCSCNRSLCFGLIVVQVKDMILYERLNVGSRMAVAQSKSWLMAYLEPRLSGSGRLSCGSGEHDVKGR
jgi:hypothetical protein